MTFSLPFPSCILNSSTQKSLKLFRRKYDAMYLIRKKGGNNNKKQNKNWNKTVSQISNCHFLLLSFYEGYVKGGPWGGGGGPWTRGHWVFSGHPKFTSEFLFWNEALLSWLPWNTSLIILLRLAASWQLYFIYLVFHSRRLQASGFHHW